MKYTTNELSKILGVSTNTIRRYEDKGFLHAVRNESNGYREFDIVDVEKLMYTSKYRKVGFSQEEILELFSGDIEHRLERFAQRMKEIDEQIEALKSIRHLLKDDSELIRRIQDFGSEIKEHRSSSMHYIFYQIGGSVKLGKEQSTALHAFLEECPEYEYVYCFEREQVLTETLDYSEGIAVNERMSIKYGMNTNPPVGYYPAMDCIMKVVKIPLDLGSDNLMSQEELKENLFGQFNRYIREHDMELAYDVFGVKLGLSHENGENWQYVLMHVPVKGKN